MAGNLATSPTFALQPSAKQVALPSNYISNFDFLSQYLPETYSEEFERYGNRSVSSFLRLVGAELPFASDLIKWTEQGRLHTKYTQVGAATGTGGSDTVEFQVNDTISGSIAIRVGKHTVHVLAVDADGDSHEHVLGRLQNDVVDLGQVPSLKRLQTEEGEIVVSLRYDFVLDERRHLDDLVGHDARGF